MLTRPLNLLLLLLLATTSGCNFIGLAAYAVGGGVTSKALFTPEKVPTVVVAENYSNPGAAANNSEELAREVSDALGMHQVAPMIDSDKVYALKEENPSAWHTKTMAEIGRQLGAKQLIYIDMKELVVEAADASDVIRGHAEVRVRLIDTKTGATIWPKDMADSFLLVAETPYRSRTSSSEPALREELLRTLSARISALFYTVKDG